MLRLPHEVKTLFKDWLEAHYPLRAEHVMSLMRQLRGGRENDPRFGSRMRGEGPFAELIGKRFDLACRRLDLNRVRTPLDTSGFRPPASPGRQASVRDERQLDLF
jgi:DNA repair photolyase